MKKCFTTILLALPGLLLAVGERTFFSPCSHADGSAAACAACGDAVFMMGIVFAVIAPLRAVLPPRGRIAADALLLLSGLSTFLLPCLMKTCMMRSMRCNALMKPAVWLISTVEILLMAAILVHDLHITKEKKNP